VLTGAAAVSSATRVKVMAAVEELGFRPDPSARALRRGYGDTVALLVGDIEQGVYSSLTKHVQSALERIGLELMLYNLGHSAQRLESILERVESMRLAGLAIATSDVLDRQAIAALLRRANEQSLPVFSIGLALDEHAIPSIIYDDEAATRRSVNAILQSHGGPVAYVGRIAGSASGGARYRGYAAALADHGIAVDEALVWDSSFRHRAGYDSAKRALEEGVAFRAIQAGSDEIAIGAMRAIVETGRTIPDDVAVVGIGDIDVSAYLSPPLTTHGADPAQVGETLVEMLLAARNGETAPLRTVLERPFIRRAST
jgi:DNA-binding LacI/PurR family transcriptional regulator